MRYFPVRYQPEYEYPEEDEESIAQELVETMLSISKKTYADYGHALRSVHVKSHALLTGEFHVLPGLPEILAQGLFEQPATYPVVMRLSTTPGDMLPDSVSTPRGLAFKIIGVKGERLPGSEEDVTQDFVMVNTPVFLVPHAKAFLAASKLVAATTDKLPGMKVAFSSVMRGAEKVVETLGGTSAVIRNGGGEPAYHPLGETFFTLLPQLYGLYMAKFSLVPASSELIALKGQDIDLASPNALREAILDFFAVHGGEWELRVQLCTDLEEMPIEHATTAWSEEKSPYLTVARLTVPSQLSWSAEHAAAIDDRLSFSPWHGIDAHRPLGSIMRVRKIAYEMSSRFRAHHNGIVLKEPHHLKDIFTA